MSAADDKGASRPGSIPAPPKAPRAPTPTAHDPGGRASPKAPLEKSSSRPGGPRALIGLTISDRYRIERLLGEGGMGAVYQAEHTLMRKRMAIKVLHPEMTRLPEVVARFEREAMAAAHIDHPHVVTATDFGKLEDGSFFLALEFVEGQSLREVIATGRLDLGRALHVARQMAGALQRAHTLKIVHRDLKPENVMLVERDGDPDFVKVLDFGIAKVQIGELGTNEKNGPGQQILTQAGMVYGTPEYMAPEQALGQPVDARADLYALGIIMFEMLCGVRPFDAESKVALLGMQVTAPVPAMATKAEGANVPPEVEALVGRLLAKEASERIADAKEVIEGISTILSALAASGRVDGRFAPPPGSGMMTNPGLISGISPSPPELVGATHKASVPPKSASPLEGRGWMIALVAGILGMIVMVSAVVYVFKGRDATKDADGGALAISEDGAVVTPETPLDEKVKEAIALIEGGDYGSGIKRLDELGDAVAGREDVHRALLEAYTKTNKPNDAIKEAALVLKSNPNLALKDEVKLRVLVRDTAIKEGLSKDPDDVAAVEKAFSLLENEMGTIGWDDLYGIGWGASGTNYPKAATRAKGAVARGQRSKMSPELQVAVDLRSAGVSCAAKNHFDRAQEKGDERALEILKHLSTQHQMVVKVNGHRKTQVDALACLHDGQLARAIAALEERMKLQKRK
ncbi:MAG: serine/threonine protein kinase [Labilithrix sp.]|nr:serine/threonine protein kinase [Labilithrix sp.]